MEVKNSPEVSPLQRFTPEAPSRARSTPSRCTHTRWAACRHGCPCRAQLSAPLSLLARRACFVASLPHLPSGRSVQRRRCGEAHQPPHQHRRLGRGADGRRGGPPLLDRPQLVVRADAQHRSRRGRGPPSLLFGCSANTDAAAEHVSRHGRGEYWGELGFFRVARGRNTLGVEQNCAWVTPDSWTEARHRHLEVANASLRSAM